MRRGLAAACVILAVGCHRKHLVVESGPELGYPACGDGGAGVIVAEGHIRSGPFSREQEVVERFALRRTPCGYVFRSRQEWPLMISDVEVHYDANLTPFWAFKRMTLGHSTRDDGNAEMRRYELRTGDVFIKARDDAGNVSWERLMPGGRMAVSPGAHVGAVVGPGRGVITPWLKRAHLSVGQKTAELVLDFREMTETLEIGTLQRDPDLFDSSLGRTVRVYRFFGRDAVFADDDDVVIGDVAGMRPSDSLSSPEPPALPTYGGADPVQTP